MQILSKIRPIVVGIMINKSRIFDTILIHVDSLVAFKSNSLIIILYFLNSIEFLGKSTLKIFISR